MKLQRHRSAASRRLRLLSLFATALAVQFCILNEPRTRAADLQFLSQYSNHSLKPNPGSGSHNAATAPSYPSITSIVKSADPTEAGMFPLDHIVPASSGGFMLTSNSIVGPANPTISGLSPSTAIAGGEEFTLTVIGTSFVNGSAMAVNGLERTTTFVDSTRLSTAIGASEIGTAGVLSIAVTSPTPAGSTSNSLDFTVNNPVPTVSTISPASIVPPPFCGSALALTVNGSNFVGSSVIRLSGHALETGFVSSTKLTAQITEADILTALFVLWITVENPGPGGGVSNSVHLTVNEPWSTITSLAPSSATAGGGPFSLVVNGVNFSCNSVVRFNGSSRSTTFVSNTQLIAQLTAEDVRAGGVFPIHVFKPAPGGATSNDFNFTVMPPLIDVFSMSPTTAASGGPGFTLTVNGNNFVDGVTVRWNGSNRATTVVSSTQLTSQISAADIQTAGQAAVAIFAPNQGLSPSLTFTVICGCGFEGDVDQRINNFAIISIVDWVKEGRFAARLDTPSPGCEFQRADVSPRATFGDGSITIADWVQMGRYAAGLEGVCMIPEGCTQQCAAGPTGLPLGTTSWTPQAKSDEAITLGLNIAESTTAEPTIVNLVSTILPVGQSSSISIDFDAQGSENGLGFSLTFDPARLSFVSAEKSIEAGAATLQVNKLRIDQGRLGIVLALPAGNAFIRGKHQLVVLTFGLRDDLTELPSIQFTDQPVNREVVDLNGNPRRAVFNDQ